MHAQFFTESEREQLRSSQYVAAVTEKTVRFTDEFRRVFLEKRCSGSPAREIFLSCGIDPDILGETRMRGITHTIDKKRRQREQEQELELELGQEEERLAATGA